MCLIKKITLNQKGSGIFSFLLPISASTIILALIPKKGGLVFQTNVIFFAEIKNKYPELFKKINYPLSNIFIDKLLKNE